MAALTAVVHLCKHGDHIICCDDSYGGTQRLLRTIAGPIYNISSSYVDFNNPGTLEKEIQKNPNTTLIMFETPSNPTLKIIDIQNVVTVAKKYNILTSCDNTFSSLNGSQPLSFGVDVVVHAITKYINGHSDVLGGVVLTANPELHGKLRHIQNSIGAVLSPFDSYLALRGVKTLSIRMEKCEKNAMAIATYLENHKKVSKVLYPGLKSHPQHELACKQMKSFGGMISFFVDGDLSDCKSLLSNLKVFALAESLGAVESLIESPALMTHQSVPVERLKEVGVEPNLVRVSVGIEDVEDLINDFDQAFSFVGEKN
jgi:cystathionine gamma-lyase